MTDSVVLTGHCASPGVAIGPALRMVAPPRLPEVVPTVGDETAEIDRAAAALSTVAEQLAVRSAQASGAATEILDAQALMAADSSLLAAVETAVRTGRPAAWAVADAIAGFQETLTAAGGYLAERAGDLQDVANRAIAVLFDAPMPGLPVSDEPYVLVAADLAPADTVGLATADVLAIVTETGGPTSHTAILAKAAGLPAVVNCPSAAGITSGEQVMVDADRGVVVVRPDEQRATAALSEYRFRLARHAAHSGPGRTADGHPVPLLLNLGTEAGIEAAAELDAEGVGLFRTEFLFLDRTTAPDQAEQERIYRKLFRAFVGRTVVVRTLDAGSDKPLAFVTPDDEPNPALGVRGYRTAAEHGELLDTQLAAIASAWVDTDADVRVMAPMISTPAEAARFTDQVRSHGLPVAGVMIEVPAAALRAEQLLRSVNFASIGTNDLSQYTFAADRGLAGLADLLDPWQPALLQLVATAAQAGRRLGVPVGVCGEAASDARLAPVLAGLGVTSLSMSPAAVPAVRTALREHTIGSCRALAASVLASIDPAQARAQVAETGGDHGDETSS